MCFYTEFKSHRGIIHEVREGEKEGEGEEEAKAKKKKTAQTK